MAAPADYRLHKFETSRVTTAGRYLGHRSYWKLYVLENIFRVLINSILTVEMGRNWWESAVNDKVRRDVDRLKKQYSKQAWRSNPGKHGIYFLSLGQLNEIIRIHAHLIRKVIPEIDTWLVHIESLKVPRNTLAHMNYPVALDLTLIDELHEMSGELIAKLKKHKIEPIIPQT